MNRARTLLLSAAATLAVAVPSMATRSHEVKIHSVRLANARWFDGQGFVARDVVVAGGFLHHGWTGESEDTLDWSGKFVVPPLADAHTHLLSDTSQFAAVEYSLLKAGVFAIKNPNLPGSATPALCARLRRGSVLEATFSNGGVTSPGGHPVHVYETNSHGGPVRLPERRRWADDAYFEVADAADVARVWPRLLDGKPDFVKLYLESSEFHTARRDDPAMVGRRGLDPAIFRDLVKRAHAAKLPVSVHATSAADVRLAVAAGVDELTHLPLERISEADARAIARAGITVVTTVVSHRTPRSVSLDAIHRDNLRRLRAANVRLALGTDDPTHDVIAEASEIQRLGAITGADLVRLATSETWRAILPSRPVPNLSAGADASLLVLDADPTVDIAHLRRIHLRMKRGAIVVPTAPATKPSVAEAMLPRLMQGNLPGAFAVYDSLRRTEPEAYDFSEQALNQLGYGMLNHGQARGAVAIFERNAELFPHSANAHDSLADGWLAVGDTTKAIAAYRRVLENLPKNPQYRPEYAEGLEKRAKEWLAKSTR